MRASWTKENKPERLFHISEESNITAFNPRPSPAHFANITGDVVFAITDTLLHNYILPRDCPRVTYYKKQDTTQHDKDKFFGSSTVDFVLSVESEWYRKIRETTLYCYELPSDNFVELDKSAGYYISYNGVVPLAIRRIDDILGELLLRKIELRFLPTLGKLAEDVSKSTLEFSLIRMRNANQQSTPLTAGVRNIKS